jgi:hypothetical protein
VNVPSSALPEAHGSLISNTLPLPVPYTQRGYSKNLYSSGNTILNKKYIFDIRATKSTILHKITFKIKKE